MISILKRINESQKFKEVVETQLQNFISEIENRKDEKGEKLVELPQNFNELVEITSDQQRENESFQSINFWVQNFVQNSDTKSSRPVTEKERKIQEGMKEIQKLDLQLAEASKKYRESKVYERPVTDISIISSE